jgi:hypothetical protein
VLCLDGKAEAKSLIAVMDHPNRAAILRAVPNATHMAGRLPLTQHEASSASAAFYHAKNPFDPAPEAVLERLRKTLIEKARMEGIE